MAVAPALGAPVSARCAPYWPPLATLLIGALLMSVSAATRAAVQVMVISGLGGDSVYEQRFDALSRDIAQASQSVAGDAAHVQRLAGPATTAVAIERAFVDLAAQLRAGDQAIIVFIGHGSFDGSEYRFNIPGPDLTGTQLATLLDRLPTTVPQLIVNATSASGAIARSWLRPYRVVITATRSAGERNAPRYAAYWAKALVSAEADRDKDEAVTAVEAFDYASRQVADAFKADAAIATEHAQMLGEDPARFVVAHLGQRARFAGDTVLQALRAQQNTTLQQLTQLKSQRAALDADRYYTQLEPVLADIARLDRRIDAREQQLAGTTGTLP
jgi:hypothetical protein